MTQVFEDVACTVCSCLCDDLTIHVDGERIVGVKGACALSEPWLLAQSSRNDFSAQIDGIDAPQEKAVAEAANLLRNSHAPLIYGLSTSSTPGQRAACHLADQLGATIDIAASTSSIASVLAFQAVGGSTATLGEVRNRADLVVYWGCNPLESHPRHLERFVESPGMLVPRGRSDRHVVVVDAVRTATADVADRFVQVTPGTDIDVISALRAILNGDEFKAEAVGGVPREELLSLAKSFKLCRYGAIFFGSGITRHGAPQVNVEALLRLVTDLNRHTRFIAQHMGSPGNVAGANNVLCWQTGFPLGVNLSKGYPKYNACEYATNHLLEQSEVDVVVLVGSEVIKNLSPVAQQHLARISTIVLDSPGAESTLAPSVRFTTAIDGVHRPGTAYRMDEVPIPLRKVLNSSLPSDEEILQAISEKIACKT